MLEFDRDTLIAICGGYLSPAIGGTEVPQGTGGPGARRQRARLRRLPCRLPRLSRGARWLRRAACDGSRSTYEIAQLGGMQGRALEKTTSYSSASRGDIYPDPDAELTYSGSRAPSELAVNQHIEKFDRMPQMVRIIRGRHWEAFPAISREVLNGTEFRVAADSTNGLSS